MENIPAAGFFFKHGLCNTDLHLSIQADIKDIQWSLWFKQRAGIVSFITHDP